MAIVEAIFDAGFRIGVDLYGFAFFTIFCKALDIFVDFDSYTSGNVPLHCLKLVWLG